MNYDGLEGREAVINRFSTGEESTVPGEMPREVPDYVREHQGDPAEIQRFLGKPPQTQEDTSNYRETRDQEEQRSRVSEK